MDSPSSSSSHLSGPVATRGSRPTVALVRLFQLCLIVPAAVGIGILYHLIAQYINVMFLFPVAAGWGVGRVLSILAKRYKVRSKIAIYGLAVVAGSACYTARWVSDSLQTRERWIHVDSARLSQGNPTLEAKAESALRRAYPAAKFFPLYMDYASRAGVGVNSAHTITLKADRPARGDDFWLLVKVELLLLCGAALFAVWEQANSAFCVSCDSWHGVALTAAFLNPNQKAEALSVVEEGEWEKLSQIPTSGATSKSNCEVLFSQCPHCAQGRVAVKRQFPNRAMISGVRPVSPVDIERLEAVRALWLG